MSDLTAGYVRGKRDERHRIIGQLRSAARVLSDRGFKFESEALQAVAAELESQK